MNQHTLSAEYLGKPAAGPLRFLGQLLAQIPKLRRSGPRVASVSRDRTLITPDWTVVRHADAVRAYPAYRDGTVGEQPDLTLLLESDSVVWTATSSPVPDGERAQPASGVVHGQRVEERFRVLQRRRGADGFWELPLTEWTSDELSARTQFDAIADGVFTAYAADSGIGTSTAAHAAVPQGAAPRKAKGRWYFVGGCLATVIVLAIIGKAGQANGAAVAARPAGATQSASEASALAALDSDPQLKALVEGRNVPMPKEFAALPADQQRALLEAAIAQAKADPVGGAAAGGPLTLKPEQVDALSKASSLTIGSGPKTVYVFEDPHCASCQALASSIEQMDRKEFTFKVLPVAFLDGSMSVAVGAMCEKDPLSTWSNLLKGVPLMNPSKCAAGASLIEANNKLFRGLGLDSTPSLIASNGAVVTGNGSPDAIKRWADQQFR